MISASLCLFPAISSLPQRQPVFPGHPLCPPRGVLSQAYRGQCLCMYLIPPNFFFLNSSVLHTPSCLIVLFPFNTWHISTLILYQLTQSCLILFTGCMLFRYVARPYILGPVPHGWALWLLPVFAIIRDAATANVLVNMCTYRRNPYRGSADRSRYAFLSLLDSAMLPCSTFLSFQ